MKDLLYEKYLKYLSEWIPFAQKDIHYIKENQELACYGTGFDEWGIQTTQKAFSAYAVLSMDPQLDESLTGLSRSELLKQAKALLRYCLYTHMAGTYYCNDNRHWGHTWLTSVGTERMMHGVDCIWDELSEEDHMQLRKVLISECDWLLDEYEVLAGRVENNRPESNIWNGSVLFRTAMYYPDAPRAEEYIKKSYIFLANGLSIDYDASSMKLFDGKYLKDYYIGDNFFRSFALGHHRYLNAGYIVISLSQIAMLHYSCLTRHKKAPDLLYRHVQDVWQFLRLCTFPDGRLFRVGGDNRVRYCYCQDYCVPVWIFMEDKYKDPDGLAWEYQWLEKIKTEREANGDGSFLSARCGELNTISPLYYTRLEADRACSLSFGVYWRRLLNQQTGKPDLPFRATTGDWQDDYHGACLVKSEKRTASWVWRAGELPTGICIPTHNSDLAEWRENLGGSIRGLGEQNYQEVISHQERRIAGGFVTSGITAVCSDQFAAEGQRKEVLTYKNVACAALPDDESMIILQYAKASLRCYLKCLKGLYLNVPNDVFNKCRRSYYFENGSRLIAGGVDRQEVINTASRWINIDDCLSVVGIYGNDNLVIYRPGRRQIGIKKDKAVEGEGSGNIGMLYCDEICAPFRNESFSVDRGTVLLDEGFVVKAGADHIKTAEYSEKSSAEKIDFPEESLLRGVLVTGADGNKYALVANFDDEFQEADVHIPGNINGIKLSLQGKTAALLSEKNNWESL